MPLNIAATTIVVIALIIAAFIALILIARKLDLYKDDVTEAPEELPYTRIDAILSLNEQACYQSLCKATADLPLIVLAQIQISKLAKVSPKTSNRLAWHNKLDRKSVDFVICDRDLLRTVLAIEVDDKSHSKPARVSRDKFVNAVFEKIGTPLLRIPAASTYDPETLRKLLLEHLA